MHQKAQQLTTAAPTISPIHMKFFSYGLRLMAIACAAAVVYFAIPSVLAYFFYEKEKNTFVSSVKTSLKDITAGESYCLVTPRFYGDGLLWVVDNDPSNIELREIISHTVRYKLMLYNQSVGPGIKRRFQLGRKIHLGVLVEDRFYHWSFRESSFMHNPSLGEVWVNKLKKMHADRLAVDEFPNQIRQAIEQKYPDLTPETAYCPHLYR